MSRFFFEENLRGAKILVACSGGVDSLTLLDALTELRGKFSLVLAAAHYEHGWRGVESLADAAFVSRFAASRLVPFRLERGDALHYAVERGLSPEMAARELRYNFLRETKERLNFQFIATAHQLDDQAETALMRILQGAGVDGLAAMRKRRGDLLRPLLDFTRKEIEAYARARCLNPRHDRTNDEPNCLRNQIRLELMPELRQKYNPQIDYSLANLSKLAAEDSDYMALVADKLWETAATHGNGGWELSRERLLTEHVALQRALLRLWVKKNFGDAKNWGFVHYEALRQLFLYGQTGGSLNLPGGACAVIKYGRLTAQKATENEKNIFSPCILNIPGETLTPWGKFSAEILPQISEQADKIKNSKKKIYLDGDRLTGELIIRSPKFGDTMPTDGGSKKLKKFFQEAKITADERAKFPVVVSGENIIWLPGLRRSNLAYVSTATVNVITLFFSAE